MPEDTTVVVGTYEGGLLGFDLDGVQRFGYAPHVGCVKALHCTEAGKLASGATDNAVKLFDLARGMELGELQEHEDAVSAVMFWGSHLVTGCNDGQVCIWRCGDYELLLKFRGHKAAVTCLAIHPSGRMMASAGRDQRIQLWDLTRGTSAAHLTVSDAVEALEWCPEGLSILALSPRELVTVEVKSNSVASFTDPSSAGFMRVSLTAATWLSSQRLALGDARGHVQVMSNSLAEVAQLRQEPGRVKAMAAMRPQHLLVIGFSSGQVEVWEISEAKRLRVVETRSRLTCLTLWQAAKGDQVKSKKRKK